MSTIRLLFPGCSTQPSDAPKGKCFSSASSHLVTSLAVATIVGAGTTLAAYFLTHGVVMWTAIGGGGAALISGSAFYVTLRCAFGRVPQNQIVLDARSRHSERSARKTGSIGNSEPSKSRRVDVKGTIYVHSLISGPIKNDRRFEYSKRLKNTDGHYIIINEEDVYLELEGNFERGEEFLFRDKEGIQTSHAYLPASLFEGVKEGETIRFLYDDKLVELTCIQARHPQGVQNTFEENIKDVKRTVGIKNLQVLFIEDLESETSSRPTFMGKLVDGPYIQHKPPAEIQNLHFYKEDQSVNGNYLKLRVECYGENTIRFEDYVTEADISDIHLIESKGVEPFHRRSHRRLWIFIPHKPERNRLSKIPSVGDSKNTVIISSRRNGTRSFSEATFNPQLGHRYLGYSHGKYFTFEMSENSSEPTLSIEEGYLELTLSKGSLRGCCITSAEWRAVA